MGRKPRVESSILIHNIGLKGHNSQVVFYDDEDRLKFIECLKESCSRFQVVLLGYVLMNNHIHAFVYAPIGNCASVFESVGSTFVRWFNRKYGRSGTLWNGRFYSKPINCRRQLIDTAAYIFNNPVKAKIVRDAGDYQWSSFRELDDPKINPEAYNFLNSVVSVDFLKKYTSERAEMDVEPEIFKQCETIPNDPVSEIHLIEVMTNFVKKKNVGRIPSLPEKLLRALVKKLLSLGSNITQISRLTGINRRRVVILRS